MLYKLFEKKSIKTILIAFMILMALVSLLQGIRNAYRDSQDFQWDAMKVFSLRINPYDESASMNPSGVLDELGYEEYYLQMEANQFPSLFMILLPFSVFPPLTARYVWIVCNLIFTAAIVYLLRKTLLSDMDKYWFSVLMLLMIAGTPYRNQIGVGQHTLFAFCFFLIALYFSEYSKKRNSVLVTIALFICYFKYTLTVPLVLIFIYKKRYKEIIISAFMHVILTFVGAWWINDSFINMILKPLKVASAISADGGLDISAITGGGAISYVLALIIMVGLFIIALSLPQGYEKSFMALLVLWSLVVTYHRTYDFFVMVAAEGLFIELGSKFCELVESKSRLKKIHIFYLVTMTSVFFVLRVFSENLPSKIAVGALYYALTFIVTYLVVATMAFKKSDTSANHI